MENKTMFEEMREAGSNLPNMVGELQKNGWATTGHHDNWFISYHRAQYTTHEAYKQMKEDIQYELAKAINVLQKHLSEDTKEGSYYHSWQCNIAMAFVDEVDKNFTKVKSKTSMGINEVANQAAKNFLNMLIKQ